MIDKIRALWSSSPVLRVFVKQAVNAACVTVSPMWMDADHYNLTSVHGLYHMLGLMGGAVVVREGIYWLPKIIAWSQTNGNGNGTTH